MNQCLSDGVVLTLWNNLFLDSYERISVADSGVKCVKLNHPHSIYGVSQVYLLSSPHLKKMDQTP